MFNVKKCFCAFFAAAYTLSSVGVFAADGDIVFYDDSYNKSVVPNLPREATAVVIEGDEDLFKTGDTFFVDFKVKNNPGFSKYGFKVEYDSSVVKPISISSDDCKVEYDYENDVKNKVFESVSLSDVLSNASEGSFTIRGICRSSLNKLAKTKGDGVLFTVQFQTLKDGKSSIKMSGINESVFMDNKNKNIPVYIKEFDFNILRNAENEPLILTTLEDSAEIDTVTEETTTQVTTETAVQTSTAAQDTEEAKSQEFKFNVPTKTSDVIPFKDLSQYPWAKDSIDFLSSLGVVRGVEWRIFGPKLYTSRADFMIIVKRFTGLEGNKSTDKFNDIKPTDYYAEAVGVITNYGLADGMTTSEFKPKANITRQEVCVILARVLEKAGKLKKSDISILDKFIDEDFVSPYAREYVADLIGMGIVSGDNKNKITPVEPITRAEVCVLVKKIYDLIK